MPYGVRTAGLMLAVMLSAAGCGPFGWTRLTVNHPLSEQDVAFIRPGETKLEEVTKRLGAPTMLEQTAVGMVASYYYYDGRYFGIDLTYPLNFFGPVSLTPHGVNLRNMGVGMDMFQVAYDARGVVQYDAFAHRSDISRYKAWPFEDRLPRMSPTELGP